MSLYDSKKHRKIAANKAVMLQGFIMFLLRAILFGFTDLKKFI